jgi:vacuolar protein sorting-associated protein 26
LFGFVPQPQIEIAMLEENTRKLIQVKGEKHHGSYPLYFDGESVAGKVLIRLPDGRRFEHLGIKVEFIGQIRIVLFSRIILRSRESS